MIYLHFDIKKFNIMLELTLLESEVFECETDCISILYQSKIAKNNCVNVPCFTTLQIINGKPVSNLLAEVVFCGDKHYDVKLAEQCVKSYAPPVILEQTKFNNNGEEHIATAYFDGNYNIYIENKDFYFARAFDNMQEPRFLFGNDNGVNILCTFKMLNKICLLVLNYSEDYHLIIEKVADDIIINADYIEIIENLRDMQGRIRHSFYHIYNNSFEAYNITFEYTNAHSYITNLLAYDFYESYIANDKTYCQNLLADDLRDNYNSIKEFLGDVSNFKKCYNNDNFCLIYSNKTSKIVKTLLANNKISDIIEVS
ncbi:MAG: hypothetical protein RR123_03730 [Clostridia bacterium]